MKTVSIFLFVILLILNFMLVRHLKKYSEKLRNKIWFSFLAFETFLMAVMFGEFIGFVKIEDLFTLDIKEIVFFLVETVIMTSCWMGMVYKIVLNEDE